MMNLERLAWAVAGIATTAVVLWATERYLDARFPDAFKRDATKKV